jgi:hypothetical protein
VSNPQETPPNSEIADVIREVFTAKVKAGPNFANALYEIARAIDRLAAAVESAGSKRSR